jgi:hypothetical protein
LYNLPSEYFEKIKNTVLISDEKTINPDVVKVKTFSERSPETKAPEIIFFYNVEKNELSFRISGHEISYVFSGKVDLKSGRVNDAEWTDVVWNGRSTPDKLSSSEASYHLESFLKKWGSKEK